MFPPNHCRDRSPFDTAGKPSPAQLWDADSSKRALDELFASTTRYRNSSEYQGLLRFVASFRKYSPFNATLVYMQMPGATFVAPASRWRRQYGRTIKPGARPLVILQPMGPVMFVFDASDTEGKPLPAQIVKPFEVRGLKIGLRLPKTIENCKRDGVRVHTARLGSQQAASIRTESSNKSLLFGKVWVQVQYAVELDENTSAESRYASLAHELAHLYCGHLGSQDRRWWPDRRGLPLSIREFEAESVAYLVCRRLGLDTSSEEYLEGYTRGFEEVPPISLECIMRAARLIEAMGDQVMKPRKGAQEA